MSEKANGVIQREHIFSAFPTVAWVKKKKIENFYKSSIRVSLFYTIEPVAEKNSRYVTLEALATKYRIKACCGKHQKEETVRISGSTSYTNAN